MRHLARCDLVRRRYDAEVLIVGQVMALFARKAKQDRGIATGQTVDVSIFERFTPLNDSILTEY